MNNFLKNTWFHPRYISKKYIHKLLFSIKNYAHGKMLDIGCGLKPYESLFEDQVNNYIGMDWPAAPGKAKLDIVADALALPILNNSVDTVLATELIEHLPDPEQFIAEVSRVLRKNGFFILSFPFMEALHEEPRDYFRFTHHGIRVILERNGFSICRILRKGGLAAVLGYFLSQSLYELANPINEKGLRTNHLVRTTLILPLCFGIQLLLYAFDQFIKESKYTLGYVIVAINNK